MNFQIRKAYRTHVVIDILLILLVVTRFFRLASMQFLFNGDGAFFTYILLLAAIYIHNMGFSIRYGIAKSMKPLMWMLIGVLISFIPAYRYYGQHLYYSLIVYRPFYAYAALPVLLSIRPTHKEFKRALYIFSVLYAICLFFSSFVNPELILFDEDAEFISEGDFVHMLDGCQFLPLAFIYALNDMRVMKISVKRVLIAVSLFALLFVIQNRTIIFASIVISLFSALSNKSPRQRLTMAVVITGLSVMAGVVIYQAFHALLEETINNLTDPEYNRVKAFKYFISGVNGKMSYIWGNGFISGYVNTIMESLRREGIFHSDLGFIGFWNQFGILAVGVQIYLAITGLSSLHSFVVRANALYILVGAMTISYFLQFGFSSWLCIFMYWYATDEKYKVAKSVSDAKKAQNSLRRFRSLLE